MYHTRFGQLENPVLDLLFGHRWGENHLFFPIFTNIKEIVKRFKSLHGFGGRSLKFRECLYGFLTMFVTWSPVRPKSIKLGQITNLNVIFHVMVSIYQILA